MGYNRLKWESPPNYESNRGEENTHCTDRGIENYPTQRDNGIPHSGKERWDYAS